MVTALGEDKKIFHIFFYFFIFDMKYFKWYTILIGRPIYWFRIRVSSKFSFTTQLYFLIIFYQITLLSFTRDTAGVTKNTNVKNSHTLL